ncbi:energy transducer TonB [Candidatus Neomarinimicrobiota bacterium]
MGASYSIRIREIFLVVILSCALAFFLFPRFSSVRERIEREERELLVETIDIPPTHQFAAPPPPARPSIPIESEVEDIPEDITIPETTLEGYEEWVAPPESGPAIRFIAYDEPPAPIGGYEAIGRAIIYPDIAREAGIEGTVVVQIYVSERGFVEEVVVLKGVPMTGLDEAAIRGIKRVRFKPAKQRDRKIGVWISVVVNFRLQQGAVVVG